MAVFASPVSMLERLVLIGTDLRTDGGRVVWIVGLPKDVSMTHRVCQVTEVCVSFGTSHVTF